MQAAVPVAAGLVGVDGGGVDELAGLVHHRHLDAGAQARVEAQGGARAGGGGEQQVFQVAAEDADGFFLGALAELAEELEFEVQRDLDAPGPAHRLAQPGVGRAALVLDAEVAGDAPLAGVGAGRAAVGGVGVEGQLQAQETFVAAAEQGQRPVGRHGADGFAEIEPVAELGGGGVGLLIGDHGGGDDAVVVEVFAQLAEQLGVFGEALHQDLAGAVQHGLGVGKAGIGFEVGGGFGLRRQGRVGQQGVGQRLDAGLAGDLGLGAALLLEGQVEVFEALLGLGVLDGFAQRRVELALLGDTVDHRGAALLELAQVAEAFFEVAQLGVVEAAGDFLAVAGDEGHRRAFVEELHRSDDLAGLYT